MTTSSSYIFINSTLRDVFEYPNSANFLIKGKQTETWNMIRSSSYKMPIQNSRNQYYNVKLCSLILPATPEVLKLPGVFVVMDSDKINKNTTYRINHMTEIDTSGFPCEHGRTLDEIAAYYGVLVADLTPAQIKDARIRDAKQFYKNTQCLGSASFFATCDKVQFDDEHRPLWVHYKSCLDQALPLNWRGHDIRFKVLDQHGQILNLSGECPKADPCESEKQVIALLEITYLPFDYISTYDKDI